jgi:ribosome-interacting GTPase 1
MQGDVSKLTTKEIEEKISALENTFAECFCDDQHPELLIQIRKRIIELQTELDNRNSKNN